SPRPPTAILRMPPLDVPFRRGRSPSCCEVGAWPEGSDPATTRSASEAPDQDGVPGTPGARAAGADAIAAASSDSRGSCAFATTGSRGISHLAAEGSQHLLEIGVDAVEDLALVVAQGARIVRPALGRLGEAGQILAQRRRLAPERLELARAGELRRR